MVTDKTPDLHVIAQSQVFPFETKMVHSREREREREAQSVHNSTAEDPEKVLGVHNRHDARLGGDSPRAGVSDEGDGGEMMVDNITDYALDEYQTHYKDKTISKESIFYYVYGLLHHPGYRKKYANNLSRELPRIPMAPDFWAFSKTGKELADLHLSWETCKRHDLSKPVNNIPDSPRKIRWGRQKKDPAKNITSSQNQHVLIIDDVIVYDNLPVCEYHVNGRTPLVWFVDRYGKTVDKESGIENWPLQNVSGGEIRAIIERLAYVGEESDHLISKLPAEFEPKNWTPKKTGLDAHMK